MKKAPRSQLGKYPLVHLQFLDHAAHTGDQCGHCECDVVGFLYAESSTHYFLTCWITEKNPESEHSDGYSIMKSAVLEKNVIAEVEI